jgi:putative transposase
LFGRVICVRRPEWIVIDNGPEFTGNALDQWAYEHSVRLEFITPGKPIENAYVESFNGKFRDECLNEQWFVSLADERERIEAWRRGYNVVRPHSAQEYQAPEEFARRDAALRSPSAPTASHLDPDFATKAVPEMPREATL